MMKKSSIKLSIILLLFTVSSAFAAENRLRAMGGLSWSVPDISAQINLYQFAGNRALLMQNDSLSWLNYSTDGYNSTGGLHRFWDAERTRIYDLSFAGQKKIGNGQMFYGDIRYIWDYRGEQHYAIEKSPYAADPFVLADYSSGDLLFHGPQVSVSFAQNAGNGWYLGAGLRYFINRGLKNIETEPEIISREIHANLDMAWRVSKHLTLGLSFLPWQDQDITKLVNLSNGQEPTTRRYRGEFEFREKTGSTQRTVNSAGYEWRPQISWKNGCWRIAAFGSIGIQNQELYDGTSQHLYDGYFQQTNIGWSSIARYFTDESASNSAFLKYSFEYSDGWAREPQQKLLIFQSTNTSHFLTIGGSAGLSEKLLGAIELLAAFRQPEQKDYLAGRDRSGTISNLALHSGVEFEWKSNLLLRGGVRLNKYHEDDVWEYFGNYDGAAVTLGFGWRFSRFEIDSSLLIGRWFGAHSKYRDQLNINVQMKQYF